ncbi:MAG TPA: hypothetical protein VGJ07_26880, partial [Rugosimonospora sp.]
VPRWVAFLVVLPLLEVYSFVLVRLRTRYDAEFARRRAERRAARRTAPSEREALKGYPTWW